MKRWQKLIRRRKRRGVIWTCKEGEEEGNDKEKAVKESYVDV